MEENRSAPDFKGLNANYHGGRRGGRSWDFAPPLGRGKAQKSFRAGEKGRLDAEPAFAFTRARARARLDLLTC